MDFNNELLVQICYVVAGILFILGLKVIWSKMTRGSDSGGSGRKKATKASKEAIALATAANVIIIPGYGMAVAQAQHEVWELASILQAKGVRVSFAIHPVAGRMPGHMDVLLAEAGVPYDVIYDWDNINNQFPNCDVALAVGANDIINPAARGDSTSQICGMPILDADKARNLIIIKRGQGTGFSDVENLLFDEDNTRMCYGDARDVVQDLIEGVRSL